MKRTSMTVMALCAMLWCSGGAAWAAPNATLTCESSKLIAQGNLKLCLQVNSANMLFGVPDGSANCWATFNAALAKADTTAAKFGTACRYVENGADPVTGDDTVSDLNTGLMWEQTTGKVGGANTGKVNDVNNTYTWCALNSTDCDSAPLELPDGTAFTVFLAMLNNGASSDSTTITGCFANHCDWRLPSIVELFGIVDPSGPGCFSSGPGPCIDPIFGPTQSNFYWTATTYIGLPGTAWDVDFGTGFGALIDFNKLFTYYVRAVRSDL
jgi:hypothetical protein